MSLVALADATVDEDVELVSQLRRLFREFNEFMAEHGHPEEPEPTVDELCRVISKSRYAA